MTDIELNNYLLKCKETFSEEELSRRLEWIRFINEETLQEEKERNNSLHNKASLLLVAISLLMAAIISLASFAVAHSFLKALFIIFIILASASLVLLLIVTFYYKLLLNESVSSVCIDFLQKDSIFDNKYSENYGRILTLNKKIEKYKNINNKIRDLLNASIILLFIAIIPFIMFIISIFCF